MKWRTQKLDTFCSIAKGKKHDEISEKLGAYRYLQIDDLHTGINLKYTKEIGTLAEITDVLIAWDGANAGKVGVGLNGMIGSTLARLRPSLKVVNSKYLYRYLDSNFETIKRQRTGATIPHVNGNFLRSMDIPLPPLHIQQQIADTLDKADALRQKDQQLLQKYDELAQSIFYDMFGDPEHNKFSFEINNLSTLFSLEKDGTKCGPFGSALKKEEYVDCGIPVWVMDNISGDEFYQKGCLYITAEKFNELRSYSVEAGDIIISRAGTVGKMCVVTNNDKSSIISTNLIRLSLNKNRINARWFVKLMRYFSSQIGRLKTGADGTFTHMNTGILKDLSFPLPPLWLQDKYVTILEIIHSQQRMLKLKNSELLFNKISQSSFS